MDKSHFEEAFESYLVAKLDDIGFRSHGRSLSRLSGENNISLIRLGGRMAMPGQISHILCFRHSFLPNLNEKIPTKFESEVFSYPIKLKPSALANTSNFEFKYYPQNLNFEYESFDFSNSNIREVEKYLNSVKRGIKKLVHWSSSDRINLLEDEITKNGQNAWIEKNWLKAYELQKNT